MVESVFYFKITNNWLSNQILQICQYFYRATYYARLPEGMLFHKLLPYISLGNIFLSPSTTTHVIYLIKVRFSSISHQFTFFNYFIYPSSRFSFWNLFGVAILGNRRINLGFN